MWSPPALWRVSFAVVLVACGNRGDTADIDTDTDVDTEEPEPLLPCVPDLTLPFDLDGLEDVAHAVFMAMPDLAVAFVPMERSLASPDPECPNVQGVDDKLVTGNCTTPDGTRYEGRMELKYHSNGVRVLYESYLVRDPDPDPEEEDPEPVFQFRGSGEVVLNEDRHGNLLLAYDTSYSIVGGDAGGPLRWPSAPGRFERRQVLELRDGNVEVDGYVMVATSELGAGDLCVRLEASEIETCEDWVLDGTFLLVGTSVAEVTFSGKEECDPCGDVRLDGRAVGRICP